MAATPGTKYVWTIDEVNFLKRNFYSMTNPELAKALDLNLTHVRTKCYELGLKRMERLLWTPEQVAFLKANYKRIGDTELAEMFSERWDKPKGWRKGQMEKKRRYLNLKRTEAMKSSVFKRNHKKGRWSECCTKAWETRGDANEVGTIVIWTNAKKRQRAFIKTKDGYILYNRWLWEQTHGPIKGKKIIRNNAAGVIPASVAELEMISMAENAIRNRSGFDMLPQDMKTAIKLTNKLKKHL